MKYVIGYHRVTGYPLVVVFPDEVSHLIMVAALKTEGCNPVDCTAGFVHLTDGTWRVGTEGSSGTGLRPGPHDGELLDAFLRQGAAGLNLMNLMAYREIQAQKRDVLTDPD